MSVIKLKTGEPQTINPKSYVLNIVVNSGEVALAIQLKNEGFIEVEGSPFTESSNYEIVLGGGQIQATFTDATVVLSQTN